MREIGSGQSAALRELDQSGALFQQRLQKVLSSLPKGEIIEVPTSDFPKGTVPLFPEDLDTETESPGDLAAQEHNTHPLS